MSISKIEKYIPFVTTILGWFRGLIPSREKRLRRREMKAITEAIEKYYAEGTLPEGSTIDDLHNRLNELESHNNIS